MLLYRSSKLLSERYAACKSNEDVDSRLRAQYHLMKVEGDLDSLIFIRLLDKNCSYSQRLILRDIVHTSRTRNTPSQEHHQENHSYQKDTRDLVSVLQDTLILVPLLRSKHRTQRMKPCIKNILDKVLENLCNLNIVYKDPGYE